MADERMIGTVLSGRYRIDEELKAGGASSMYLAQDLNLERQVAIKVLESSEANPEELERFNREARAVAKLTHPHIVSVVDAGSDDGRRYIVFEFVKGESLKERIERLGRLPIDESATYAIEIGRAISAAHTRKLIHRDVKPQNVLIDREGHAKLTDFGVAGALGDDGLTDTATVLGSTDYASPEQAAGESVDERTDIYSLGIVLFEMLTGELPFHADTSVGVAMKHATEEIPDVQQIRPETSAALAAVVEKATEKDHWRRYRHIAAMVDDLEEALEVEVSRGGGSQGEVAAVLESVPEERRLLASGRSPWFGIGIAVFGLAVLGTALLLAGGLPGGGGQDMEIPLRPQSARDFDPAGDNGENPGTTGLAVDGNPSGTPWETESYGTPELAGKPGVGLYVDARRPVAARAVEIRTSTPGWDVELRAADGAEAPLELDGWTVVGGATDISSRQEVPVVITGRYRYYLLWITQLPPEPDNGRYSVAIEDLKLLR